MAKRSGAGKNTPPHDLTLQFHGRVLEHLGIQMYQKPVNTLAELVANAWDADSPTVDITVPTRLEGGATITVRDTGSGMTFDECQEFFLNVGRNRREKDPHLTTATGRRVLGRKGIGKFAGFGIAKIITVDTVSERNGEHTVFVLRLEELLSRDYVDLKKKKIAVVEYETPSQQRTKQHGTTITLSDLTFRHLRPAEEHAKSMARRFQLQSESGFEIRVNASPVPDEFASAGVQFVFPGEFKSDERPDGLVIAPDGWGEEELENGRLVRWRFLFFKEPIEEEELRGISVFTGVKVALGVALFVAGACATDLATKPAAIGGYRSVHDDHVPDPSDPTDPSYNGSADEASSADETCPSLIKQVWIPGTIPDLQDANGQGHPVSIGGMIDGAFRPFSLIQVLAYSDVRGTPKGKYRLPLYGAPWFSQDKKLAVLGGTVTGWCHFVDIVPPPAGSIIYTRTGKLDVVEADLQVAWNSEPVDPDPQACYQIEEDQPPECDSSAPTEIGQPKTIESEPWVSGEIRVKTVCMVTDWFELYQIGGWGFYKYLDTIVDGCWDELA